jgi:hypothetical protein
MLWWLVAKDAIQTTNATTAPVATRPLTLVFCE